MHRHLKRNLAIGTTALAATAFAGGAYAANQQSPNSARQAFLADVAKRLNVTPQQLTAALKGASLDQLNAAVKAGKLTQAQANAIKQRIEQGAAGPFPFPPRALRGPRPFGPAFFGPSGHSPLGAAANYLGLTDAQLFDQLQAGKTLAQIAQSHGKSVAGLKQAMFGAEKARLDEAVKDKLITPSQEQQALSRLSSRLNNQLSRTLPRVPFRGSGHWGGAPNGSGFPNRRFFPLGPHAPNAQQAPAGVSAIPPGSAPD
ncbi:MAG: hypothetical protein JO039_24525 [Solirubrobacterales bacterium]|nr:hypothetical protein [Solirubrobacterales bacterium]